MLSITPTNSQNNDIQMSSKFDSYFDTICYAEDIKLAILLIF